MKRILVRLSAIVVSFGLVFGLASVAGAGSYDHYKPYQPKYQPKHHHWDWQKSQGSSLNTEVKNENNVAVTNQVDQTALTGAITIENADNENDCNYYHSYNKHPKYGCRDHYNHYKNDVSEPIEAKTGDAYNESVIETNVSIENTAPELNCAECLSDYQGYKHYNNPSNEIEYNVSNTNDVVISNDVNQQAISGNVTVAGNSSGGSAISGDASNTSTITNTISLTN